jgi:hypothetical protein
LNARVIGSKRDHAALQRGEANRFDISRRDLRTLKAAQTIATNLSDMRGHVSLGTKAAMTRQSLDLLRQRYVIKKNL